MPGKEIIRRAKQDAKEGKAESTQAGEFVREEFHHAKTGKHKVKNRAQAVAIGLSKARQAGIKVPPPPSKGGKRTSPRKKKA